VVFESGMGIVMVSQRSIQACRAPELHARPR
jgi:hypothetical protein